MLKNKTIGIKIPSLKEFYYVETGDNWIGNPIDRIKKTLIQRNVLKVSLTGEILRYDICTYQEIVQNNSNYEIKPIYLSKHVEKLLKESDNNAEKNSGLFKS
tara:strand:+ start:86 stop:391 length:306 start_codon:yes stop_codon:yes gene_type:complete